MREGFISFDDVTFNGSDTAFLWIRSGLDGVSDLDDVVEHSDVRYAPILNIADVSRDSNLEDGDVRERTSVISHRKNQAADEDVFGDVVSTINRVVGNEEAFRMGAFKISASMKSSTITVNGEEAYGIYFEKEKVGEEINSLSMLNGDEERKGARTVFLEGTNFNVSDGIAIYGENSKGYVILNNKSRLSSSLFLQAGPASDLSVFLMIL